MRIVSQFDPWKGKLCTCPFKYSFSPYVGCSHHCLYCYASSYIPNFFQCRPKQKVLERLRADLNKIPPNSLISMANSSDPYAQLEAKLKLTQRCLQLFAQHRVRLLLITKSNLVARDAKLLSKLRACISFSITTLQPELASKLEPNAPMPELRLKAAAKLIKSGVPVSLRLDPIIPGINEAEVEEVVKQAASIGIKHLTSSTYKARPDNWKRMIQAFPKLKHYQHLYFEQGEKISNSYYLPGNVRLQLMQKVKDSCLRYGLSFACCREGFKLNSASCDSSHLIPDRPS